MIEAFRPPARKLVGAAAAVGVLALASCAPEKAARPACPAGQQFQELGNTTEPLTLDPAKATGTYEDRILSDINMGLTQDDAAGGTIPGMAERWETSADGLTWTFHLREAKWSDGVPMTADDFVFSLRRVLDPKLASEYAYLLYFIKNAEAVNGGHAPLDSLGVRALDARTLQLTLEHPAPYLPEIAKHTSMFPVPKHLVEKYGDAWKVPGRYAGLGAYRLVEWRLGDRVRVVRNPWFYDAAKVCFDRIDYFPTVDAVSAERRVLRGELDVNGEIQSNRIGFLLAGPGKAFVRTHTYVGVNYLALNAHVPAFRDARVRRALDMAIDRDFITGKLLRAGQQSAYTFVPPGIANYPGAAPPDWARWTFAQRQAEARRLLSAAGYGPARPLRFELKHPNSPDAMLIMPAIQADFASIGVEVSLAQNETQVAYNSFSARDFDVAAAAWIADFNDAMSFLALQKSSTGSQNYGDYNSAEYDRLLNAADHEPDATRRAQYMRRAETIMLNDAPVVPIFFYTNKNLVSPRITGWTDNIIDHHRARYLCAKNTGVRPPGA